MNCVQIMCDGMPRFQHTDLAGVENLHSFSEYCYVVAGSVGEMLLKLFSNHCSELKSDPNNMQKLAISFGQGLQMVNILKDLWKDRAKQGGVCWLPRSLFENGDEVLRNLETYHVREEFQKGLKHLIGVTHGHLRCALEFTCNIPESQAGIRQFCALALGLAILTLRKINKFPTYSHSDQVKVSRKSVYATWLATRSVRSYNSRLKQFFELSASGIPLAVDT